MKLWSMEKVPQGDYVFQVKWDGVRMLAFVGREGVVLQNRNLALRTKQYPELQVLSHLLHCDASILDGEVVAPRISTQAVPAGGTSFQALLRRDFATNSSSISTLMQEIPIHYVVFDMLSMDSRSILHLPLEERLELMRQNLSADELNVSLIEDFSDGEALHTATRQSGYEGVVAKEKGSPYLPGQRVPLWQKIKHRLRDSFPVIGYTMRDDRVNSLVIGVKNANHTFRVAGKVGSGLTEYQISLLTIELPNLATTIDYIGFPRDAVPVHPYLMADVEFMEWTDDNVVRAPSLKGFSFGGEEH